jgi:hypothetical protein
MNAVARLGAGEVYYGPAGSVVLRTEVGLVRLRKKKRSRLGTKLEMEGTQCVVCGLLLLLS